MSALYEGQIPQLSVWVRTSLVFTSSAARIKFLERPV